MLDDELQQLLRLSASLSATQDLLEFEEMYGDGTEPSYMSTLGEFADQATRDASMVRVLQLHATVHSYYLVVVPCTGGCTTWNY